MITTRSALSFVLLFTAAVAQAQEDYNVNFSVTSSSGTEHVTGFIDLMSGTTGQVSPSEITAWSLDSVAGSPVTLAIGSATGGTVVCPMASSSYQCGLVATPNALTFSPPATMAAYGTFFEQAPIEADLIGPYGGPFCNSCLDIFTPTNSEGLTLSSVTLVATRTPEIDPASALTALTLLLGSVAVLAARRRETVRVAERCYG
jgi:hypothetical protein